MLLSILISMAASTEPSQERAFPDPMPAMMEACLLDARDNNRVSKTADSWKYICTNTAAEVLWQHMTSLEIESWQQTVSEGTWLSRSFPLGGCFRQLKDAKGNPDTTGLSCTIWIPRK